VGIDDTDILGVGGTGRLARSLAAELLDRYRGLADDGVSRHQLLQDPRVPSTRKNRCSCLVFSIGGERIEPIVADMRAFLRSQSVPGSDPGLCVATETRITPTVMGFGFRAKRDLLSQEIALATARAAGLLLEPLGGTGDGIVGALAAVGLRRSGEDGWVTRWGRLREVRGMVQAAAIRQEGCEVVDCASGAPLAGEDFVDTRGKVRPVLDGSRMVLLVRRNETGVWEAVKPSS
jgi:hypothetical protein